ncbi:peptidase dimerization domain-containing protein, partial [Vibrio sp. 10N.222.49.C9]
AKRYHFSVKGMAGHAGTVPHALRMDALCGVAEMITTIETYGLEHNVVATVGKCNVKPGAVNVIPGDVVFSLDVRSPVQGDLEVACNELHSQLEEIAQRRELQLTSELTYQAEAVPCNAELQQQWGKVVEK